MEDSPRPFVEHLEELRFRLIKSLSAIVAGTAIAYCWVDRIVDFLAKPVGKFVYLQPTEAFFVRMKIALAVGALLALPVVIFQIWRFIVLALSPLEKRSMIWILPASYVLFLCGASFGFFVLAPAGIRFLLSYTSPTLVAQISIEAYVNFVGVICLALGGIFQMPLVTFFLSKIGILHWKFLSEKRRVAVLLVYALSAWVTPGPDPVTALLLAVPTYLLFECSILTSKWAEDRYR